MCHLFQVAANAFLIIIYFKFLANIYISFYFSFASFYNISLDLVNNNNEYVYMDNRIF